MIRERIILIDESNVPDDRRGGELIIHKFPFRIGRQQTAQEASERNFGLRDNDLYLEEQASPFFASRCHVEIGFTSGTAYVRDLGSAKGTLVNGKRLGGCRQRSTALLEDKENEIQIGGPESPWRYRLVVADDETRFRMVIADDERNVRTIVYEAFKSEYDVVVAKDGWTALHACITEAPDIVVLDWMMPELEGVAVCKHLKSNLKTANLPVVMLTGRGQTIDRISGIEAGADDYITKPFDVNELKVRVNAVMARSLHAKDVHWLTGIASEGAFREELDRRIREMNGTPYEVLSLNLNNLGVMQDKHGFTETDSTVKRIAEALWREALDSERTVVGQVGLGRWAILLPAERRKELEKVMRDAVAAIVENTPLKPQLKRRPLAKIKNYYDYCASL